MAWWKEYRLRLQGDPVRARQYVGLARKYLGIVNDATKPAKLRNHVLRYKLDEGVDLTVQMLHGQAIATIAAAELDSEVLVGLGFVIVQDGATILIDYRSREDNWVVVEEDDFESLGYPVPFLHGFPFLINPSYSNIKGQAVSVDGGFVYLDGEKFNNNLPTGGFAPMFFGANVYAIDRSDTTTLDFYKLNKNADPTTPWELIVSEDYGVTENATSIDIQESNSAVKPKVVFRVNTASGRNYYELDYRDGSKELIRSFNDTISESLNDANALEDYFDSIGQGGPFTTASQTDEVEIVRSTLSGRIMKEVISQTFSNTISPFEEEAPVITTYLHIGSDVLPVQFVFVNAGFRSISASSGVTRVRLENGNNNTWGELEVAAASGITSGGKSQSILGSHERAVKIRIGSYERIVYGGKTTFSGSTTDSVSGRFAPNTNNSMFTYYIDHNVTETYVQTDTEYKSYVEIDERGKLALIEVMEVTATNTTPTNQSYIGVREYTRDIIDLVKGEVVVSQTYTGTSEGVSSGTFGIGSSTPIAKDNHNGPFDGTTGTFYESNSFSSSPVPQSTHITDVSPYKLGFPDYNHTIFGLRHINDEVVLAIAEFDSPEAASELNDKFFIFTGSNGDTIFGDLPQDITTHPIDLKSIY